MLDYGGSETRALRRYGVIPMLLTTGERLPMLVDLETGRPPEIALRHTLDQRQRGGSARIEGRLRRIAFLHEWFLKQAGFNLNDALLAGERMQFQLLFRALEEFKRAGIALRTGEYAPAAPATFNLCISAWLDFLQFAAFGDNWRSGRHPSESSEERADRHTYIDELRLLLNEKRESVPESDPHLPLAPHELEAIDSVLFDDDHPLFQRHCLERNRLLYRTVRSLGPRISEALKVKVEDLPSAESTGTRTIRLLHEEPRSIHIVRRPDDPDDPRRREARVKRGDRYVETPDDLADDLRAYAEKRSRLATRYLFISSTNDRKPLSVSRSEKIINRIGRAAQKRCQELYPQHGNSLESLCWHRLRTTRAIEALDEFFPDGMMDEETTLAYLRYFGWHDISSAEPYLRTVRSRRAREHRRAHREALLESLDRS